MATAEGPVAEFSSFANFEEKKRKSNLLMPFPKTGNQMGSFGQIRKKLFFRFCRPILDIFGFTLLIIEQKDMKEWILQRNELLSKQTQRYKTMDTTKKKELLRRCKKTIVVIKIKL